MFIDLICLALVVLAIFKGLRNGLVVGIFSFLGFVIGLATALKLSTVAASYLGSNTNISQRWLPFIAFAGVFLVVVLLVRLGAKAIEGMLQVAMLGWANRLGGIILYALLYLFILSVILFYISELNIIKPETLQASVTYPYLQPLGPKVISLLGALIPWFKNMFGELESFFENVSKKAET